MEQSYGYLTYTHKMLVLMDLQVWHFQYLPYSVHSWIFFLHLSQDFQVHSLDTLYKVQWYRVTTEPANQDFQQTKVLYHLYSDKTPNSSTKLLYKANYESTKASSYQVVSEAIRQVSQILLLLRKIWNMPPLFLKEKRWEDRGVNGIWVKVRDLDERILKK